MTMLTMVQCHLSCTQGSRPERSRMSLCHASRHMVAELTIKQLLGLIKHEKQDLQD